MGTPDFAVASLRALVEAGENVVGVVTAPDRPAGRGQQLKSSPVKIYSTKHNIPVLQPVKLKDPSFTESLKSLNADIFIVVAFRMLPEVVWKMPLLGTFNLHASLLPQYRGAAPINWVVINGERETGLTTFLIDEKIDTGKIILQEKVSVSEFMTAGELHDLLMEKGAKLVLKTVRCLLDSDFEFTTQSIMIEVGTDLKPAPKLFKEDCKIDWTLENKKVYNHIRGLSPYPGAWTIFLNEDEEEVSAKILLAEIVKTDKLPDPGTVSRETDNEIIVYSENGAIRILKLQAAGKKPMSTNDFLRGYRKKLIRAI